MGKNERSRADAQADYISGRQKENRSGTESEVGEAKGGEEGGVAVWEPATASTWQAFKVEANLVDVGVILQRSFRSASQTRGEIAF